MGEVPDISSGSGEKTPHTQGKQKDIKPKDILG